MVKLSLRIYLLANLAMVITILIVGYPFWDDLSILFIAAAVSLIFSLPVIPALLLIFWMVGRLQQNIFFKWILFLVLIAGCATLPWFLFEFLQMVFSGYLLQFSILAAFLAVLFQANPIHQYLINSYGKENPETI
jgi:hypothetical protein